MEITVRIEKSEDTPGVNDIFIQMPKTQEKLSTQQAVHILIGGVNMLIKSCSNESGIKDYELMEEVIDHLKSEFIDVKSFENLFVDKKYIGDE